MDCRDIILNNKDMLNIIFSYLTYYDMKKFSRLNKTSLKVCDKYKEFFKYVCLKCKKFDSKVYMEISSLRRYNIEYTIYYKRIIKEFCEYRCRKCITKCDVCNYIKNINNLIVYDEYKLRCKNGCESRCRLCYEKIGNKNAEILGLISRLSDDIDLFIIHEIIDQIEYIVCSNCLKNDFPD